MKLNIIVCIKSVVVEAPVGKTIRTADNLILNPFDRPALEIALTLREAYGGTITALSMGPPVASVGLYEAIAMGVDHGILISDKALAGSDTLVTSSVLAAAIRKLTPCDLIVFGARTADSDTGQVGPQTATALNLPMLTGAMTAILNNGCLNIRRRCDEFTEEFEMDMPAAITVHPSACQPRDASLAGIQTAFSTAGIETWSAGNIGVDPARAGEGGSPTRVVALKPVHCKRTCEFVEGSIKEQALNIVQTIKNKGLIG